MGHCFSTSSNSSAYTQFRGTATHSSRRSSHRSRSSSQALSRATPSRPSMQKTKGNSTMSITNNNSFTYHNQGREGKLAAHSSNSENEHILTTYSRINTPKGSNQGSVVQSNDPRHKNKLHYNNDPERGQHFHNSYKSRQSMLDALRSTDLAYEASVIEEHLNNRR